MADEKSDFVVLKEMMDSGNKGVRSTVNIIKCDLRKKHGEITFAVDKGAYHDITRGMLIGNKTHYCIMYVIEKSEFDYLKDK